MGGNGAASGGERRLMRGTWGLVTGFAICVYRALKGVKRALKGRSSGLMCVEMAYRLGDMRDYDGIPVGTGR